MARAVHPRAHPMHREQVLGGRPERQVVASRSPASFSQRSTSRLFGGSASSSNATHATSIQDVLDAPAHQVAEILDGTFYTNTHPPMPHARASSALGGKIGTPFDYDARGPGG